ncbi:imidazolonepropionase-like domain-containing protein [Streptomyces sp. NPDC021093]|uniref:imidazolonepropionase-like domain-containing protein n=1 Tax=Streptomyces sp. NPDC021093 TaxID=3365112 RepID=UPI0037B81D41
MLTIHRVLGIRDADGTESVAGDAVVVDGDRIAAVGTYEELAEHYGPRARTRTWDGYLTPGRYEPDAVALLQTHYWPDPREADVLGTEPLTGQALHDLDLTDTRWGASARRGVQRLLSRGTTAVAGPFTRPAVRVAVERSPVRVLHAPRPNPLTPSAVADFAVFAEPGGECLVTVVGGRLVFRRA